MHAFVQATQAQHQVHYELHKEWQPYVEMTISISWTIFWRILESWNGMGDFLISCAKIVHIMLRIQWEVRKKKSLHISIPCENLGKNQQDIETIYMYSRQKQVVVLVTLLSGSDKIYTQIVYTWEDMTIDLLKDVIVLHPNN